MSETGPVIHTIGNGHMLRGALDAISAIFSGDTGLLVGNGGLGVGSIAVMLVMGLFAIYAIKSLTTAKLEFLPLLLVLIAYVVLFTIKTDVTIQDHYDNSVYVVDDIPIGVAYPGWAISATGYYLTEVTQTAYSNISAGDGEVAFTVSGFVQPLRMLMSTRDIATSDISTHFARTWREYIVRCLVPSLSSGRLNPSDLYHPADGVMLNAFFNPDHLVPGLVAYWDKDGNKIPKNCVESAVGLNERLGLFVASDPGAELSKTLTGYLRRKMGREEFGVGNATVVNEVADSENKLKTSLETLLGPGIIDARDFIGGQMIRNSIHAGIDFATSTDITATAMLTEGIERAKVDAGGAASQFLNTVFFTQGFFQFLFFTMAPFVALMFLVRGLSGGGKLLGSWMLLGIWAQLFYVTAAIINSYAINMVRMQLAGGAQEYLTLSGFDDLYNQVGAGLLVANNGMASSGMIILVFLTGSIYTLNSLAQQTVPRDTNPEEYAAPRLADVSGAMHIAPVSASTGNIAHNSGRMWTEDPTNTSQIAVEKNIFENEGFSTTSQHSLTAQQSASVVGATARAIDQVNEYKIGINGKVGSAAVNELTRATNNGEQFEISNGHGSNTVDSKGNQYHWDASTGGYIPMTSIGGKMAAGVNVSTKESHDESVSIAEGISKTLSAGKSDKASMSALLEFSAGSGVSGSEKESWSETANHLDQQSEALSQTREAREAVTTQSGVSLSNKLNDTALTGYLNTNGITNYAEFKSGLISMARQEDFATGQQLEKLSEKIPAGSEKQQMWELLGTLDGMTNVSKDSTPQEIAMAANAVEVEYRAIDAFTSGADIRAELPAQLPPVMSSAHQATAAATELEANTHDNIASLKSRSSAQEGIRARSFDDNKESAGIATNNIGAAVEIEEQKLAASNQAATQTTSHESAVTARNMTDQDGPGINRTSREMRGQLNGWLQDVERQQPESVAEAMGMLKNRVGAEKYSTEAAYVTGLERTYISQAADLGEKEDPAVFARWATESSFSSEIADKTPVGNSEGRFGESYLGVDFTK